jgi:cyclopropane-fatty-acyl-phospholipid synthase
MDAEATWQSVWGGASADAIRHHYDVGNDFYRLWLDETLAYTCALYEEGDTLETAQLRKLAYHVVQARAAGAERVLDVGCGWGNSLRPLVERHGVKQVVGLTLSEAQAQHVRAWNEPRCQVRVENWRAHAGDAPYDAVFAFGVMEHMVRFGLARNERTAGYRQFFERCHGWLKPGGRLALQTIAKGSVALDEQGRRDLFFIATEIFPESDVPRLAEIAHAAERLFEVVAVRNDRLHYARTCRDWLERLERRRGEAVAMVGERTTAAYERYLRASVRQFELGHSALLRVTLARV